MAKNQIKIPNVFTGVTASGEVKSLSLELIKNEQVPTQGKSNNAQAQHLLAEEYLLINKIPEKGVTINARLQESGPSFSEKIFYMIGEACFAGAMDAKALEKSEKEDLEYFSAYMEQLTQAVIEFHK